MTTKLITSVQSGLCKNLYCIHEDHFSVWTPEPYVCFWIGFGIFEFFVIGFEISTFSFISALFFLPSDHKILWSPRKVNSAKSIWHHICVRFGRIGFRSWFYIFFIEFNFFINCWWSNFVKFYLVVLEDEILQNYTNFGKSQKKSYAWRSQLFHLVETEGRN